VAEAPVPTGPAAVVAAGPAPQAALAAGAALVAMRAAVASQAGLGELEALERLQEEDLPLKVGAVAGPGPVVTGTAPGAPEALVAGPTPLGRTGSLTKKRRAPVGLLQLAAVGAVVAIVLAASGWELSGGSLSVMETPSMCPTACVGSLVADRPVAGPVHVGELVSFHPPDSFAETYTHYVYRIFSNGMIQTRGAAELKPDPWLITRSDIVSRTVFTVWGLGWLLRALPMLAVGVLLWVVARQWITEKSRRSWDRIWLAMLVVVPVWVLHPLVRGAVRGVSEDLAHHHWTVANVINTGLLPVSFSTSRGEAVAHVSSTAAAQVAGPVSKSGYLLVRETISLYWWGWVLCALVVLSPMLGYLWHVLRDDETAPSAAGEAALLVGPEGTVPVPNREIPAGQLGVLVAEGSEGRPALDLSQV
jgi:hypothetical protein